MTVLAAKYYTVVATSLRYLHHGVLRLCTRLSTTHAGRRNERWSI